MLTNAVANRFGDGPNTPAGVRERVARSGDPSAEDFLSSVDDDTVAEAIAGAADLLRHWVELLPGQALRLTWPLPQNPLPDRESACF